VDNLQLNVQFQFEQPYESDQLVQFNDARGSIGANPIGCRIVREVEYRGLLYGRAIPFEEL
jgi:hypothetical protein